MAESLRCARCRLPLRATSRFEVLHYGPRGVRARAQLCSVTCLLAWAVAYGVRLGRGGVEALLRALPRALPPTK